MLRPHRARANCHMEARCRDGVGEWQSIRPGHPHCAAPYAWSISREGFCVLSSSCTVVVIIATANDYELKLYNGDTGVVVDLPDDGARSVRARR